MPQMMTSSGAKRKEIYKYEAPWTLFAMSWSNRPDKRFRLALGSFVEEYNNKVGSKSINLVKVFSFFFFLFARVGLRPRTLHSVGNPVQPIFPSNILPSLARYTTF